MSVELVINSWDPINLLPYAPDDEYHSEITAVIDALTKCDDVDDLTDRIIEIFSNSFGITFVSSRKECSDVARQLLSIKGIST